MGTETERGVRTVNYSEGEKKRHLHVQGPQSRPLYGSITVFAELMSTLWFCSKETVCSLLSSSPNEESGSALSSLDPSLDARYQFG